MNVKNILLVLSLFVFILPLVACAEKSTIDVANKDSVALGKELLEALRRDDHKKSIALINAGADLSVKDDDAKGCPALNWAVLQSNKEVVELLVKKGANLETECDRLKGTPLAFAIGERKKEVAKLLIDAGANIHARSSLSNASILHAAVGADYRDIIQLILDKGGNINDRTGFFYEPSGERRLNAGNTPLYLALERNNIELAKFLINRGADINFKIKWNGAISYAVANGDMDFIKFLIDKGADIYAKTHSGGTLLHMARNKDMAEFFLAKGFDVNAINDEGATPIIGAAAGGQIETVKLFIEKGADVNAVDKRGRTALYNALFTGRAEVANLLIEKGAKTNIKIEDGQTPLHQAARYGFKDIVSSLLDKGADINAVDKFYGQPPLVVAIGHGHLKVAKLLIERGADLNVKARFGGTPLAAAKFILKDPKEKTSVKERQAIVDLLIARGAKE